MSPEHSAPTQAAESHLYGTVAALGHVQAHLGKRTRLALDLVPPASSCAWATYGEGQRLGVLGLAWRDECQEA